MSPQFNDMLLCFIKVLISKIEPLKYLGDIPHVKDVVTFSWGREEVFLDGIEESNGGTSEGLTLLFDVILKGLELELRDGAEDFVLLEVSWHCIVDNVEL